MFKYTEHIKTSRAVISFSFVVLFLFQSSYAYADASMDDSVAGDQDKHRKHTIVCSSGTTCYAFYPDSDDSINYVKTTNAGSSSKLELTTSL